MISLVKPGRQTEPLGGIMADLTNLYPSNLASSYSRGDDVRGHSSAKQTKCVFSLKG